MSNYRVNPKHPNYQENNAPKSKVVKSSKARRTIEKIKERQQLARELTDYHLE